MGSMEFIRAVDFKVFGRVQGVFFRKYARVEAVKLGVLGWIRNERDGTVIGVIQGNENGIHQMKNWLSNKGSPRSRIDKCEFSNQRRLEKPEFYEFSIKR